MDWKILPYLGVIGLVLLALVLMVFSGCLEAGQSPGGLENVSFSQIVKGCAETVSGTATRSPGFEERPATIIADGNSIIFDRAISHLCCRKAAVEKEFSVENGKNVLKIFEIWSGPGCRCQCSSELGAKIENLPDGEYVVRVVEKGTGPDGSPIEEKTIIEKSVKIPAIVPGPEPGQEKTTIVYYQGKQCEPDPWGSSDIESFFAQQGIEILDHSSETMMVCQACGVCPKSAKYAATILEKDKSKMLSLGWTEK